MKRAFLIVLIFLPACGLLGTGEDSGFPGKIVFSAIDSEYGTVSNVFTIRPDGSELTLLTDWKYGSSSPEWSPDGSRILFSSNNQSAEIGSAFWLMNADGSNKHLLKDASEPHLSQLAGEVPRWSPDGEKLVFYACRDFCGFSTNYEIIVYNTLTGELNRLTEHSGNDTHPRWSPDGEKIVFISERDYIDSEEYRHREDLYIIDADGSNIERLTFTGLAAHPVWHPNGTTIVYRSTDSDLALFQINVQTGETEMIWEKIGEDIDRLTPMTWSPDGTKLLVIGQSSEDPLARSIYILNLETEQATRIPYGPARIYDADWNIPENQ